MHLRWNFPTSSGRLNPGTADARGEHEVVKMRRPRYLVKMHLALSGWASIRKENIPRSRGWPPPIWARNSAKAEKSHHAKHPVARTESSNRMQSGTSEGAEHHNRHTAIWPPAG